jgi:hypothetical protein
MLEIRKYGIINQQKIVYRVCILMEYFSSYATTTTTSSFFTTATIISFAATHKHSVPHIATAE